MYSRLSKKLLLFIITLVFPALWFYNQKINYRRFLQFDRSMLLIGAEERRDNLSSVVEVINLLNKRGLEARLLPKVIATSSFGVLGRTLDTKYGVVEVYEYTEVKKAKEALTTVNLSDRKVAGYKNLLLMYSAENNALADILSEL